MGNLPRRIFVSLALQVKKFINSEHTGAFIDIVLPQEIELQPEKPRKAASKKKKKPESSEAAMYKGVSAKGTQTLFSFAARPNENKIIDAPTIVAKKIFIEEE
jgi:hypothetical protein